MKRISFLVACALFAVACKDSTSPPVATTIVLSASTVSLDALGATQIVTATVNDQHGQPMSNSAVTWTSNTAAATVVAIAPLPTAAPASSATITATLNGASIVTATSGKASATISVNVAQTPAALQKTAGDAQVGTVNSLLLAMLSTRVVDRLGAAIAGQQVTFAVTQGGGTIGQTTATSGADGIAATSWTLGKSVAQSQQVAATLGVLPSATFTATPIAGAPASIAITAGDGQTGTVGASLGQVPQVLVSDAFSNPVGNAVVTFTATGSLVAFPSAATNAAGVATAGLWTLGGTPGTKTLSASVSGASAVSFSATARVGPPASMTVTGNNQSAATNTAVTVPPSVRVTDSFANPIADIGITFAVGLGGGSLTGATTATDANGIATVGSWRLGPLAGTNTLTIAASGSGLSVLTLTATGTTGPSVPGTIAITAGGNQAVMAGQPVPIPPSIIVRDASGIAAAGVSVTFAVGAGGGTITGASATTNANGLATVGSWTAGSIAALNTLTATVSGYAGSPVTFSAAGCEGGGAGYSITVCYRTAMTSSQRQAFVDAAARWKTIVTADLPDITSTIASPIAEGSCDTNSPSIGIAIDDLLIFAGIEPIDGVGNVLGSAGWCFRRTAGLPVIGTMRFDVADVAGLEATNRFGSVILHEMGHVLGIGSMWNAKGLLQNPSTATTPLDTYFSGVAAIAGFDAIGGTTYTRGLKVPVENTGGVGTMNSHWRESVLANELMTGFLNSGANPLSILTIRSLEDLGYAVNAAAADPFSLMLSLNAVRARDPFGLSLEGDVFKGPQSTIDTRGRITRIHAFSR